MKKSSAFLFLILGVLGMTTSAWAAPRMIIDKVTYQVTNEFVTTIELPDVPGWYVTADQSGRLMQPHIEVSTYNGQSAGVNTIILKNADGKAVAELEDKGILGAAATSSGILYQSTVLMFIQAGTSDAVGEVFDSGFGIKERNVTISPEHFGPGSQLILKFAGKFPEQSSLLMNATLWGDETQVTNIPGGSLGQVRDDQSGAAGGGQATITIDFELVDE